MNYSGEITVGYDDPIWPQYIWIYQELKKSPEKRILKTGII
jgi:hypothetical protein